MIYLLPTSGKRGYRGVFPGSIRYISMGAATDADGVPCIHVETNAGDRYTIPRCDLDMAKVNTMRSFCGHSWMQLLKTTARYEALSKERYADWLAGVLALREEAKQAAADRRALQAHHRAQARSAFLRTRPTLSTNWMK